MFKLQQLGGTAGASRKEREKMKRPANRNTELEGFSCQAGRERCQEAERKH